MRNKIRDEDGDGNYHKFFDSSIIDLFVLMHLIAQFIKKKKRTIFILFLISKKNWKTWNKVSCMFTDKVSRKRIMKERESSLITNMNNIILYF